MKQKYTSPRIETTTVIISHLCETSDWEETDGNDGDFGHARDRYYSENQESQAEFGNLW